MFSSIKKIAKRLLFASDYATERYLYHSDRFFDSNRIMRLYHLFWIKRIQHSFGSSIPLGAFRGKNPTFPHGLYGIFISSRAVLGKNIVFFHHVTIGSNTLPNSKKPGAPTIGDNCYIGAGAKIIGGIKIGDNVRVGANCVVFDDVPSNSTVVAQPYRVVSKSRALDNSFVTIQNFKK